MNLLSPFTDKDASPPPTTADHTLPGPPLLIVRDFEGTQYMHGIYFPPRVEAKLHAYDRFVDLRDKHDYQWILGGGQERHRSGTVWLHFMTAEIGDKAKAKQEGAWLEKAYKEVISPWALSSPVGRPALYVDAVLKKAWTQEIGKKAWKTKGEQGSTAKEAAPSPVPTAAAAPRPRPCRVMVICDIDGNMLVERVAFCPDLVVNDLVGLGQFQIILQTGRHDREWRHRMSRVKESRKEAIASCMWLFDAWLNVILPWSMTDPVGRPALYVDAVHKNVKLTRFEPGWFDDKTEHYAVIRASQGVPRPTIVALSDEEKLKLESERVGRGPRKAEKPWKPNLKAMERLEKRLQDGYADHPESDKEENEAYCP